LEIRRLKRPDSWRAWRYQVGEGDEAGDYEGDSSRVERITP